jgi:hypothetical protein
MLQYGNDVSDNRVKHKCIVWVESGIFECCTFEPLGYNGALIQNKNLKRKMKVYQEEVKVSRSFKNFNTIWRDILL